MRKFLSLVALAAMVVGPAAGQTMDGSKLLSGRQPVAR